MRDPRIRVGKVLEEGSSGQAGRWVLRQRGLERGYESARARTEQSGERGEDPGRRKGKDLSRGPGLSVGDATSAGCGLSGELGSGSGPRGERSGVGLAALGRTRGWWHAEWAKAGLHARDGLLLEFRWV